MSLLNRDYKILTKLLANRLQKVLPLLIKDDQTGCLKGRFIGENIRKIIDIFENTSSLADPGLAVFLDFEKAFDTVSWQFLKKTLKNFNFGKNFIKWIDIIYNRPLCCVTNNGKASDFFEISRGIRQGCPLSALLFILVAEVMAINIRGDETIEGITIGNLDIKLSQYADDTSLFVRNITSLTNTLQLLEHYGRCAGLKVNKEKSEIIQLGVTDGKSDKSGLKWVDGPIKTLGVWVGKNTEEIIKINFEERIKKLENMLNMWQGRSLTIKGKITLLRAQALPLILYTTSVLFTPKDIINRIDSLFYKFIWPKGKHHVKKEVLVQNIENGGLKMPDVGSMIKSLKLTWIKRLIDGDTSFSKIASNHAKIPNIKHFIKYKNEEKFLRHDMPSFYKQIFSYWFEIFSINPVTHNEVLNEYIQKNKFILINDKPISGNRWSQV